ncbi:unnamed protein product [Bursaphelenchus okinawaensis]|uniref:SWI/SNF-like complex subunit BAF250 C-terminal domain-containing protein n=1 Tax=Bursaphelenchus okinawaensis TaxID=465554 RepID=A0A811JWE2_9BILA|nr:unnamed protein product [Bursaphelenchus okinawaensis]CAG9085409.1 unnamed protein product [Bursaphelenchus okinawaensis]
MKRGTSRRKKNQPPAEQPPPTTPAKVEYPPGYGYALPPGYAMPYPGYYGYQMPPHMAYPGAAYPPQGMPRQLPPQYRPTHLAPPAYDYPRAGSPRAQTPSTSAASPQMFRAPSPSLRQQQQYMASYAAAQQAAAAGVHLGHMGHSMTPASHGMLPGGPAIAAGSSLSPSTHGLPPGGPGLPTGANVPSSSSALPLSTLQSSHPGLAGMPSPSSHPSLQAAHPGMPPGYPGQPGHPSQPGYQGYPGQSTASGLPTGPIPGPSTRPTSIPGSSQNPSQPSTASAQVSASHLTAPGQNSQVQSSTSAQSHPGTPANRISSHPGTPGHPAGTPGHPAGTPGHPAGTPTHPGIAGSPRPLIQQPSPVPNQPSTSQQPPRWVPGYPPHNSADPQQPPYYYQQPGQPLPHHPAYPGWSGQPLPPGFPQHAYPPHVRPPGAAGYPPGYGPQFHQQPTMPGQQNLPGLPNMAQGLTPASTLQPASNLPPSASNLPPTAANLPPTASTLQPAQPGQQPAPQPASQQPAPPQIQPPAIKTEQDQQPLSVGDQSSRSTPAPPPQTSRPPSQAHYQPPSTPDTHEQQRPNSRQPVKPAAHTPVPTSSTASMPGPAQPPPQMPPNPMNMPPHTSQPYYPSQAYRPVPNRPQYSVGYPDPNQYQHPNMYPPQQQQMWPPTSQPAVPPRFMNPPQMPGKPQQEFRRPQPPSTSTAPPPQGQYYMQNQQMASPSSSQRQQRVPPQVQQMPPAATTTAQQYPMHMQQRQMPVNPSFPPGCIEATASAAALRRKRPRAYAREMTWATPKRLTMALRSGLELDTLWAINTLTVILYDDTAQPLLLSAEPQLLSLCLEHFKALLAVLYPKDFKLIDNAVKLQVFDDFSEATDKPHKNSVVEMAKLNSKPDKKSKKQNNDFTAVSRTGRKVYVEKNVRKPFLLERIEKNGVVNGNIKEEKPSIDDKPKEKPKFISGLCHRIYQSLLCKIESKKGLQRLHFSKHDVVVDEEEEEEEEFVAQSEDDLLFFRRPKENETWNRDGNPDVSLIPRPSPLINRDACLEEIGDRLLAMSNIIRGFSFFPGNEKILYNNLDLLDLIGRLLMLKVKRDEQLKTAKIVKVEEVVKPDDENEKKPVPSEVDSNRKMLLEVANQLRDDAFTILSHISVQLDLYNVDSGVAYGLLDALIYWAVTHNVQAKDPINGAVYSPKLYTFEIICKMSLLEANIDLLLSTGPWPRIEEFVRVVANSVNMSEELPLREFAIVILTAVCQASEPACIVATLETDVIQNLVSFLEAAEFNITTIATTEGVSVLRDNPERMGTSFGMLRRAAQILACLAQYEVCRPYFVKHQSRLLSFTVSSYMDSRVAGMVAGILYDLQHIPKELLLAKEVSLDESHRLAEAFPSYKWKVSDDTEDPPEPFLNVTLPPPTNPFHVEAQKELGSVSISPDSRSMSPNKTNGTAEVNGNRQKHRKRSRHSDGREMTALESALLNDSDAESGPESDGETSQPNSDTNSLPAAQPAFKTASSTVKEKLRNNINMKHGISENGHDEEPEAKRQRISNGVSAVSPKCNGDLNNKVRPNKSENGNGTPTKQSGSMAAVA